MNGPEANAASRPRLSIVIPTYNGWHWLRRCLVTVQAYRPADSEVIVVDDASRDDTCAKVRAAWPDVIVVCLEKNGGFCTAANAGLAAARGDFVELLNNDTEVTPGWTDGPLAALCDPSIGAVAPLVCKLPFRHCIDSAGDNYFFYGVAKKRGEGKPNAEPFDAPAEVFGASASSAFYRRAAVRAVGGFPEHFGAYLDDVDLSFRLRLAGYRCLYVPSSRIFHWVSMSHRVRSRRMLQQVARNTERVFWTNLPADQLLMSALPHFLYVLVHLAYKSVRGEFAPWFAGRCTILGELSDLLRRRRSAQALSAVCQTAPLQSQT